MGQSCFMPIGGPVEAINELLKQSEENSIDSNEVVDSVTRDYDLLLKLSRRVDESDESFKKRIRDYLTK